MATLPEFLKSKEGKASILRILASKWSSLISSTDWTPDRLLIEFQLRLWVGIDQILRCANNHPELLLVEMRAISQQSRRRWKELVLNNVVEYGDNNTDQDEEADEYGLNYRLPWNSIRAIQDDTVIWDDTVSDDEHRSYVIREINSIAGHEYKKIKKYYTKHKPYDESGISRDIHGSYEEEDFDPRDEPLDPDSFKHETDLNSDHYEETGDADNMDEEAVEAKSNPCDEPALPLTQDSWDLAEIDDILEGDEEENKKKDKSVKRKKKPPKIYKQFISGNEVSPWMNIAAHRPLDPVQQKLIAEEEKLKHDRDLDAWLIEFKNGLTDPLLKEMFEAIWEVREDIGFDGRLPRGTNKNIAAKLGVSEATSSRLGGKLHEALQEFVSSKTEPGASE